MNPVLFIACLTCKTVHFLLRLFKHGGTALPGKIALRICPDVLSVLARNFKIVAVTGTNGKTTTCRMLETGFRMAGCTVFANHSGANLLSGITTEFILNSSLLGRPRCEWAIIECDEAASVRAFEKMRPCVVLVTNLFRDQLDRYGEITHARDCILKGLKNSPESTVCLNADCSLTSSIAEGIENHIRYFGVERDALDFMPLPSAVTDATHCIRCKTKYDYSYVTYAHLGGYRCPHCGYQRKPADTAVTRICSQSENSSRIEISIGGEKYAASVNLPAIYNIYNAAGSISAMTAAGISVLTAISAISEFTCAFGRMEDLAIGKSNCKMILVKNPAAMNQAIDYYCDFGGNAVLILGLNDRYADGTDISWIWDANLEPLGMENNLPERVIVFGDRSAEMALRLKYADIDESRITIVTGCSCKEVVNLIESSNCTIYILLTYTAMMNLRREIVKKDGVNFWEQ